MESSAGSRITLANLIHDVESTRAHRETLRSVLRRVVGLWDKATNNGTVAVDPAQAAKLLSATLDQATDDVFCTEPNFTSNEPMARIVDSETLTEFFVLKGAYGELVKPHSRFKRPPVKQFTESQLQEEASVRGGRPMAWATKAVALEKLEKELEAEGRVDEIATRVRDFTGLDYIRDGVEIVEMTYPRHALDGCRISAPTVLEGSCREVYRSYFDQDDLWGRTVDLQSNDFLDGAPEAVHPPIRLTAGFTYRHLGAVRGTRRLQAEKLEGKCVRRWVSTDITILLKYIA